jgi:hypothetical protein
VCIDVLLSSTTAVTSVARGRRTVLAATVAEGRMRARHLSDPIMAGGPGVAAADFDARSGPFALDGRSDTARPLVLVSPAAQVAHNADGADGEKYREGLGDFAVEAGGFYFVDENFIGGAQYVEALQLDAGSATHPVVMPVVSIDAVSQAFDEISYSKGGTVIRMIEETIGEAGFRDGMRRYMKKYAYGNANTDQLWAELQAATGKPVSAIAHDFTLQPGVPLVRVEDAACSDNMTTLKLTQARFETDGTSAQKLAWRIPLRAQSIGGGGNASVITGARAPIALQLPGCAPVIVNAGQAGYFRTLYGPAELVASAVHFPTSQK